jgi:hypothetical protein
MNMKKYIIYAIVGIISVAILAFAYYAISPFFRHIKVDEQAPVANTQSLKSASVIGTSGHSASGAVRVIVTGEKSYIRYENFKTINGPDLYVYLAKDLDAKDFVNLGILKATEGNVNYEVPDGVDVKKYRYVMTWCKQFGVLFNYADISSL